MSCVASAAQLEEAVSRIDGARTLTTREAQVCMYAAHGYSNKTIACELGISRPRVTCLLSSAMRKLHARTQVHLIRKLHELGGFELLRRRHEEHEAARSDASL